jgi:hypothetical protein
MKKYSKNAIPNSVEWLSIMGIPFSQKTIPGNGHKNVGKH